MKVNFDNLINILTIPIMSEPPSPPPPKKKVGPNMWDFFNFFKMEVKWRQFEFKTTYSDTAINYHLTPKELYITF